MGFQFELQNLVTTFFGSPGGLLAVLLLLATFLSLTSCSPDPPMCPHKYEGQNWGDEPSKYLRP